MSNKIIMIGRASVGKTSIRKVIFEGHNPNDLLNHPISPTRGIESIVYSWMDLELGLFDTSGQELAIILREEETNIETFKSTDVIIYVIDYPNWEEKSQDYIEDIQKISRIIENNSLESQLILFLHKVDKIGLKKKIPYKKIRKKILDSVDLPITPRLYFTSISPDFIYNTYNAFFEILGDLSQGCTDIKNILDKIIKKYSKLICIVLNHNNSIIIQSITDDFNPEVIRDIYKKIAQKYLTSEKMVSIALQIQVIAP